MARWTMTPDDFLKGQLVGVGWNPSQIISYEEKISPAGLDRKGRQKEASMYIELQFKITDGPSKGLIVYQNFSEKAPTFIAPLLEAFGATVDKTKVFSFDPSKDKFLGKTVDIHVVRGTYEGKPKNEIDGYRPYTGKGAVVAGAQAGV